MSASRLGSGFQGFVCLDSPRLPGRYPGHPGACSPYRFVTRFPVSGYFGFIYAKSGLIACHSPAVAALV